MKYKISDYKVIRKVSNKKTGVLRYFHIRSLEAVYAMVPKAGCSSIKYAIADFYGINKKIDINDDKLYFYDDIHRKIIPYQKSGILEYNELLKYNLSFSFVRNPFHRLASAWHDKIVKNSLSINDVAVKYGKSFDSCIKYISGLPDSQIDNHFMSQYFMLSNGGETELPSFIGRFENISNDWKKLNSMLGGRLPDLKNLNKSNNTSDFYDSLYTEELKDIVKKRFRKDFEMWYPQYL